MTMKVVANGKFLAGGLSRTPTAEL